MGSSCSNMGGGKEVFKQLDLLPTNELEISLSDLNIPNHDNLSKSKLIGVIYKEERNGSHKELGQAVIATETSNPVCKIDYCFAVVQTLIIKVYCLDANRRSLPCKSFELKEGDYIGEARCTLSEGQYREDNLIISSYMVEKIVTKNGRSKKLYLQKGGDTGTSQLPSIIINAKETAASRTKVELDLRCSNLVIMDGSKETSCCLRICILEEKGGYIPIFQTEAPVNNVNPVWRQIFLPVHQPVSKDSLFVVECYNVNTDGTHALVGELKASLDVLENLQKERTGVNFYSPSSDVQDTTKMLESQLFVDKFHQASRSSFVDYVSSGFQLKFMVAVDFSASSGNPQEPSSLHYIHPSGDHLIAYQIIKEVGEVIEIEYESDNRIPLWGFGGKQSEESANQIFNLNGENECEVTGTEGMVSAYTKALQRVPIPGPTAFMDVIKKVFDIVRKCCGSSQCSTAFSEVIQKVDGIVTKCCDSSHYKKSHDKYYVLLIITNGVMNDLKETIDSIVSASDLPLSILIAGVGAADFTEMQIFSADGQAGLKSSSGRIASRNIVQFVSIPKFPGEGDVSISQSLLGKVPEQFLEYMRSRNIEPHPLHDE